MRSLLSFFSIGIFLLMSCKSPSLSLDDYDGKYILFGKQGGFTGASTDYCLTEEGRVYKKTDTAFVFIKKIEKPFSEQIFKVVDKDVFKNFQSPGNYSNTLTIVTDENKRKMVWDPNGQNIPAEFKTIHKLLLLTIKKS